MASTERRGFARIRVTSENIQDLSLGGVFVVDPQPFPVGTEVAVELEMEDEPFSLPGVVSRSIPNSGMAIEFRRTPQEAQERLERYLRTVHPNSAS